MPRIRIPKPKLSFFKKLLRKRSRPTIPSEPDSVTISQPIPVAVTDTETCQKTVQKEKGARENAPLETCPICHDPVGVKNPEGILESWVHLHCKHKFGTSCIQTWLQESAERDPQSEPSCPICRETAKHPCGHPLMTGPRPFFFSTWATPMVPRPYPAPRPPPPSPPNLGGRVLRRLSRRSGHTQQPIAQRPRYPHVQTVGECSTCAASAAWKKNTRQTTTISANRGHSNSRLPGRNGNRRSGIKSMFLPHNPRQPTDTLTIHEYANEATVTVNPSDAPFSGVIQEEHVAPMVRVPIVHAEYGDNCQQQPDQGINRRLSL